MGIYFSEILKILLFLVVSLNSKPVLGRLKIPSCHVKVTLNSIKSVEANIITGLGLDTPPLQRSQKAIVQKTAGNIYQTTTEQLMTPMPCSKLSNCRFRVSGQDGEIIFSKIFVGPLYWQCQLILLRFGLASTFDTLPSPTNLKR